MREPLTDAEVRAALDWLIADTWTVMHLDRKLAVEEGPNVPSWPAWAAQQEHDLRLLLYVRRLARHWRRSTRGGRGGSALSRRG